MAHTLSTACWCCVIPIDQINTLDAAAPYRRAKRTMSSYDAPDAATNESNDAASSAMRTSSNPVVCSLTNFRSIVPSASMTFMTPLMNATSPPT